MKLPASFLLLPQGKGPGKELAVSLQIVGVKVEKVGWSQVVKALKNQGKEIRHGLDEVGDG